MSETPSRIGPYEILARLGAGGMGQVYRARDPRLQRQVAIKILPEAARLDPDRRRRFAQEAVAASALNHPNILTVYDVGVDAETPYLVAELIEGDSLRNEMNRGKVPLKRAIEIIHQIAEGLTAAHDAGIVHRDLKPENVMVTPDGRVKIVDFGLAKGQDDDAALLAQTGTQTASGLIIGTVPYMSPEQARGGKADFRSDQFALGVLLYELMTATHPFRRDTAVQTLSAIITDEPPDPTQLNATLPWPLRWLMRRLLAKNPRDRYAHTADVAADLRTIREFLNEATSSVGQPVVVRRTRWIARAALLAVAAATVFALGRGSGSPDTAVGFDRFMPLATDAGYQGEPAWSPDGKSIVYGAEIDGVVQIFTRTLNSPTRTKITNSTFDCYSPVWSSDGFIYYHSLARDNTSLWRVSPVGGAAEVVIENATRSHVSPDGKTAAFFRDEVAIDSSSVSFWIASPIGSEPRRYSRGVFKDRTFSSGEVRFSPDGSKVIVWLGADALGYYEIPMPDGEPRELRPPAFATDEALPTFSWMPDSRHLVLTRSEGANPGTHLWLADSRTNKGVLLTATPGNESTPSVSPDGHRVAFASASTDFDLVEVPLDGSPLRPFLSSTRNEFDPAASPVNSQYAFVTDRAGELQIWLQNEEGYLQQALVTAASFDGVTSMAFGSLAFSPDGKRLAFQRVPLGAGARPLAGRRLWITSLTGGTPIAVGGDGTYYDAVTWSPDSEWIAYLEGTGSGTMSLIKSRVGGLAAPVVVSQADIPAFVVRPQWSPDGRWIMAETLNGLEVFAADGAARRVISDPGWLAYAWEQDSRRVYGLRPTEDQHHFMLVSLDSATGQ
jgi:serine/threonine protein kinase